MTEQAGSPLVPNAWYVAALSTELGDSPLGRTILNQPVVLFRTPGGGVAALEDRCCHRGFPLRHGRLTGQGIACGYHGLQFDETGRCVAVPGQDTVPPGAVILSFPVVERHRMIWIWPGDPALADPAAIPDYPYHDDPDWPFLSQHFEIGCNYQLLTDNLLDPSHVIYVHVGTIGGHADARMTIHDSFERSDDSLLLTRWTLDSQPPPTFQAAGEFTGRVDRWQQFRFVAPAIILMYSGAVAAGTGAYENGMRDGEFAIRMLHAMTPESEHRTHYFWTVSNGSKRKDDSMNQRLFNDVWNAFKQDEFVLEEQYRRLREFPERAYVDINTDRARLHSRRVVARAAERRA